MPSHKKGIEELLRIYDLLGISFDSYLGESFYPDQVPEFFIVRSNIILKEAIERAHHAIIEKNPSLTDKEATAKRVDRI